LQQPFYITDGFEQPRIVSTQKAKIDMDRKYALIIGNTEYKDLGLGELTASQTDVEEFARVLRDPEICGFDFVNVLINQTSFRVFEAIEEFFDDRKPADLLVLYYSGLGVKDEAGSLYLAFSNTIRTRLRSTAIKPNFIEETMEQCRSKRQIVILDSCNVGAFSQGTKAEVGGAMGLTAAFQGYGRFVLTASDLTQFAWEGDQVIGKTQNSLLTHFLVKGLEGDADNDGDGNITVDELYDFAYEQICKITPEQTPSRSVVKQIGGIFLRQNARTEKITPLPDDLLSEIEDMRPYVRAAAVEKLKKILEGNNPGLVRSAVEALEKIVVDDNTTQGVARAATQVLESYQQRIREIAERASVEQQAEQPSHVEAESEGQSLPAELAAIQPGIEATEQLMPEPEVETQSEAQPAVESERVTEEPPVIEKSEPEREVEESEQLETGSKAEPVLLASSEQIRPAHRQARKSAPRRTRTGSKKATGKSSSRSVERATSPKIQTETKPVLATRDVSIWKFGTNQILQGLLGAALYAILGLISAELGMDLKLSILIFYSLAFGPWVGLITGVIGQLVFLILRASF
jgi:hypothetical protein